MDFDEIFRCPKWDKEQVIRFGSDLDHCLDHLDPGCQIIVSTGGIRCREIFRRREIFGVNALRQKLHQLGSPNLQDIFIGA